MVKNPKKLSNMLQNLVDIVSGNNLCEEGVSLWEKQK